MSNISQEQLAKIAGEIIDKSSDGIIIINDRNEILYANPAWKTIHGFDPEKSLNQEKVFEILFPDPAKRRESIEMWNHDIALENPPIREAQRETGDGSKRWYRFQASHLDNGYNMVRINDITDRKLLELKFRAVFEKAPDAIILHEIETGRVIEVNEKAIDLLGYTRKELQDLSIFKVSTKTPDQIKSRAHEVMRKGHDYFESSVRRKNGEIRHVFISTTIIEVGSDSAVLAIVHDITERKSAENALEDSKLTLQKIIEQSPIPMVIASMDGTIEHINRKAIKTFGHLPEDVPSLERLFEKAYPDSKYRQEVISTWTGLVEKAIRKQCEIESQEYRITCKNGETKTARITGVAVADKIFVMAEDITAHKLAQVALKENEERFRKIFEQAPISMAIVSMDGVIEYINRKAIDTFGYLPEDIPDMDRWWVKAYPDAKYRQEVISTWMGLVEKAIKEQREIERGEYRVTCKNGREITTVIFGVPVANKVFVMFDDITERKRAETALMESEEKFRNLADQSPNMIFINKDRRVVYANQRCAAIMGYSLEEICSPAFNFMCLIAPEFHALISKSWARHMKGEEAPSYEYDLITKKGKRIHAVIATKLVQYEGGPAVLGIVTDISELKMIQKELKDSSIALRAQKKELQQKNIALKEILAQIETEKLRFKQQVSINAEKFLLPAVQKLRARTAPADKRFIDVLESSIKELVSSFGLRLSSGPSSLSPREMEISNMIKTGLSSKEIAEMLHVSLRTVDTHRNRIRRKLRISATDVNLASHLQKLT